MASASEKVLEQKPRRVKFRGELTRKETEDGRHVMAIVRTAGRGKVPAG